MNENVVALRRPVHGSSFHFRDYLVRKYGYETPIEDPHGFILYRINGDECNIGEIYVEPSKRQLGIATELADKVTEIARQNNCKYLVCQTQLTGKDDELSMLSILHYGFKPIRAHDNVIVYAKEL